MLRLEATRLVCNVLTMVANKLPASLTNRGMDRPKDRRTGGVLNCAPFRRRGSRAIYDTELQHVRNCPLLA